MLQKTRDDHTGIELEVNERILDACTDLMKVLKTSLCHLCLISHKGDLCKQCRPRSDAASDQGLHCLHTEITI